MTAEEQAKWGKTEGSQAAEFKFYKKMLEQARAMARRGETSALLSQDTCHTQGMYVLTPSGKVLGMVHQWSRPDLYVALMRRGLARWKQLSPKERRLAKTPDRNEGRLGDVMRADLFPRDGLVLTEITRALPYEPLVGPRYKEIIASHPKYCRLDHAWLRKDEARQFLPEKIEKGASQRLPRTVLDRLVRFHLGTNTDTIAGPFGEDTIKEARLTVVVVGVTGDRAECRLEGRTVVDGPQDSADRKNSGYASNLLGRAVYDLKAERFVEFDLVALGIRHHGGNEVRKDTPNPIPLGVLLTLSGQSQVSHFPPAYLERYGW
jgi:hypothetical protein